MEKSIKPREENNKKVFVRGYTTSTGRVVPDHYRANPDIMGAPKGTFIERRLLNPKIKRY
jgi:hypothetical protein